MTFCLGMNLQGGLVGIADTRVIAGNERITARKVSVFQKDRHAMFLMSAGLRSARDKALIYFEENLAHSEQPLDRLFKAVNAFAAQVRRVAKEDKAALEESGFEFNLHALIGGQLENDPEHRLYLVYPQGNWVEIGQGTPYHIIGAAGYGKPILDRTLHYQDPMRFALKVGCLAFDSTRISAVNVDFPLDVVLYARDSHRIVQHCYQKEDLQDLSNVWQEGLRRSINNLSAAWVEHAFDKLALPDTTTSRLLPAPNGPDRA